MDASRVAEESRLESVEEQLDIVESLVENFQKRIKTSRKLGDDTVAFCEEISRGIVYMKNRVSAHHDALDKIEQKEAEALERDNEAILKDYKRVLADALRHILENEPDVHLRKKLSHLEDAMRREQYSDRDLTSKLLISAVSL